MILVRHAMTEASRTARPAMRAADAAGLMANFDVDVVPATEDGRLVGLVTDRDLVVRVLADRRDPTEVPLRDIVTATPSRSPPTCSCRRRAISWPRTRSGAFP